MAHTTYSHVQIGNVDKNGNVEVIYPLNYASDVKIEKGVNEYLVENGIVTAQQFAEIVGDDIVYLKNNSTDLSQRLEALEARLLN